MVEFSWAPTTPLSRALIAGRHGAKHGAAGVSFTELRGFELVQVMARRGQSDAMSQAATRHFDVSPPAGPQAMSAGGTVLIGSGPDQFMALAARDGGNSLLDASRQLFAGIASLSDQSDGRALIRIAGPAARATLAKLCLLDLHPSTFPVGMAAATSVDHTSVNLWRGDDAEDGSPAFFVLVFSSFAESLWRTMLDAGAEYGIDIGQESAAAWLS